MKKIFAMILAVTLILCLAACGADSTGSQQVSCKVTVSEIIGTARALRYDGLSELLNVGSTVSLGDSVITDRDSTATLTVEETDTTIMLSPSSEILFKTAADSNGATQIVVVVKSGSIANSIDMKLEENDVYEVCTGDMTMAIQGTDAYVGFTEKGTSVALLTGKAYVFNYFDNQVYTVPVGVQGYFSAESAPSFELIDVDAFAAGSSSAAMMLDKVEKENPDFEDDFETSLRDSYLLSDVDYSFSVSVPVEGAPTAKDALENAPKETTATTTTTTATETTTTSTETTTTEEITVATTTTVKSTTRTTAKATTTTAKATTTTTKATTTTTKATEPTAPTEPTVIEPTTPTAPTVTEPTTTTTTTVADTGVTYRITFTGLYCMNASGEWTALTEYTLTSLEAKEDTATPKLCQYNGEDFQFTVTWNDTDYAPNHTDGVSYILYADAGGFPETYQDVYTLVTAEKIA